MRSQRLNMLMKHTSEKVCVVWAISRHREMLITQFTVAATCGVSLCGTWCYRGRKCTHYTVLLHVQFLLFLLKMPTQCSGKNMLLPAHQPSALELALNPQRKDSLVSFLLWNPNSDSQWISGVAFIISQAFLPFASRTETHSKSKSNPLIILLKPSCGAMNRRFRCLTGL